MSSESTSSKKVSSGSKRAAYMKQWKLDHPDYWKVYYQKTKKPVQVVVGDLRIVFPTRKALLESVEVATETNPDKDPGEIYIMHVANPERKRAQTRGPDPPAQKESGHLVL